MNKLLIYDGECAYCRGFARLLRRLDRGQVLAALPFDDLRTQDLLRAQFDGETGFAMYLFERDAGRVSWGAAATRRIAEGLTLPRWTGRLASRAYPAVVSLVSRLTGRTRVVCGPGCTGDRRSPPDLQGTSTLKEEARRELKALLDLLP